MLGCRICAKHRGEGELVGPVVWQDELVVVTHRPGDLLGYLFVETRRHVPYFDELTEVEVGAVARTVWLAGRALRAELSPEYVFSLIMGRGVAHFHQHVYVAPEMPGVEINGLSGRLARHFG